MTRRATLFFEPLDVLQFRDHRPFDAGYHVTAGSIFPMPSVFLGCLRTALLRDQGVRFGEKDFGLTAPWARELLGTSAEPGTLTLRGPLLALRTTRSAEPLFPSPLDIFRVRLQQSEVSRDEKLLGPSSKHRGQILGPFRPTARRFHWPVQAPYEGDVLWSSLRLEKGDVPRFFTRAGAARYLTSGVGAPLDLDDAVHAIPASHLYERETRVGIVRNDEHLTAEERMFYVTRPFRLANGAGFAVDVELPGGPSGAAICALDGRVVPLGGKAHRARIHCFDGALIPDELAVSGAAAADARKLWLITPLVLGGGAWPPGVACTASDRTVPVGGFDLARRAPKPLRQALPAGTVLTIHDLAPDAALAALGGDAWHHYRRAGFGVALACKGTEHP